MFALFDYYSSFYWLQNIDDSELGFTLSYGLALFEEFEMHLLFGYYHSDPEAEDKHAVMLIVSLKQPVKYSKENLSTPLFVILQIKDKYR
jgi:flagellar assembly factor FliW